MAVFGAGPVPLPGRLHGELIPTTEQHPGLRGGLLLHLTPPSGTACGSATAGTGSGRYTLPAGSGSGALPGQMVVTIGQIRL